jgi:hypothetical protein
MKRYELRLPVFIWDKEIEEIRFTQGNECGDLVGSTITFGLLSRTIKKPMAVVALAIIANFPKNVIEMMRLIRKESLTKFEYFRHSKYK